MVNHKSHRTEPPPWLRTFWIPTSVRADGLVSFTLTYRKRLVNEIQNNRTLSLFLCIPQIMTSILVSESLPVPRRCPDATRQGVCPSPAPPSPHRRTCLATGPAKAKAAQVAPMILYCHEQRITSLRPSYSDLGGVCRLCCLFHQYKHIQLIVAC